MKKGVSRRQGDKKEWGEEQEMRKRKCRGVELREEEQIGPFPKFTLNTLDHISAVSSQANFCSYSTKNCNKLYVFD